MSKAMKQKLKERRQQCALSAESVTGFAAEQSCCFEDTAAYTMDGFIEMARFSVSFEEAKAFKASRNQGIRKNEWHDLTVVVGIRSKIQR